MLKIGQRIRLIADGSRGMIAGELDEGAYPVTMEKAGVELVVAANDLQPLPQSESTEARIFWDRFERLMQTQ